MGKIPLSIKDLDDDQPIRLEDACQLFFANAIKPTGLRAECKRGNLEIMRIAGKDFVTKIAIEGMKKRCRVNVNRPTFSSEQKEDKMAKHNESGLSKMGNCSDGQVALKMKLAKQKSALQNTSLRNIGQKEKTQNLVKFPLRTF